MDALSDVLRAVRLNGAVFFDIHARAPWAAESPATERIGSRVMPGFERVIFFHIVLDGSCWARLADDAATAVRLDPGDAVVVPGGDRHVMASDPSLRAEIDPGLYRAPRDRDIPYVFTDFGGSGAPTRYACGFLGYDARPFNPLIAALPPILHVRGEGAGGALIRDLARAALAEAASPGPGSGTMLGKLSELVFLQAIRQHIASLPAGASGWFAALADPHVGRALGRMHAEPSRRWMLEQLAAEAGLSRSSFAERFAALVGTPPMQYLARWRLQRAAHLLRDPGVSIAQAAAEVGYESEAAFNRAFRKETGMPPGAWRRSRRDRSP